MSSCNPCAGFSCQQTHWSVKLFTLVGIVGAIAAAVLIPLSRSFQAYGIMSAALSFTNFAAAFIIRKYYTLKTLDDVSSKIGQTAAGIHTNTESLRQQIEQIQGENTKLQDAMKQMEENSIKREKDFKNLQAQLDQTTQSLEGVTEACDSSKAVMHQALDLMHEICQDDTNAELQEFEQTVNRLDSIELGGHVDRAERVKLSLQILGEALQKEIKVVASLSHIVAERFAKTAQHVDEAFDANRRQLERDVMNAGEVTQQLENVQKKIEQMLAQLERAKNDSDRSE